MEENLKLKEFIEYIDNWCRNTTVEEMSANLYNLIHRGSFNYDFMAKDMLNKYLKMSDLNRDEVKSLFKLSQNKPEDNLYYIDSILLHCLNSMSYYATNFERSTNRETFRKYHSIISVARMNDLFNFNKTPVGKDIKESYYNPTTIEMLFVTILPNLNSEMSCNKECKDFIVSLIKDLINKFDYDNYSNFIMAPNLAHLSNNINFNDKDQLSLLKEIFSRLNSDSFTQEYIASMKEIGGENYPKCLEFINHLQFFKNLDS